MFGRKKIELPADLWEKVRAYAEAAGYSGPQEFVVHAVEKALASLEEVDSDETIRERLKGLGYIE